MTYSKNYYLFYIIILISIFGKSNAQETKVNIKGLTGQVTIYTDRWGVAHIEAENEADLFFAQGYNAAKDRSFQFEIWRLQATGTAAQVLGASEIARDKGLRLFKFRGDIKKELQHYHPRGLPIIEAFVKGINAYIDRVRSGKEMISPEFKILGILPGYWTPEVVISRHQGLLANVQEELLTVRQVLESGPDRLIELNNYQPHLPDLSIDTAISKDIFKEDLLAPYNAFRKPLKFESNLIGLNTNDKNEFYVNQSLQIARPETEGSNNWVVDGNHSFNGYPMLANDPHRAIASPSLRYIVHLKAPGWNVIGGGEPTIPGISIGHNESGAWGLTIFSTDAEDMYIYKTNPLNPNQYWYKGHWEMMKLIKDTILVKDKSPVFAEYKYTIHGPVTYENSAKNQAAAVRCAWLDIGGAPYLASLRMNQADSWVSFKDACNYSHIPAENMVWADKKGNIGWQAVGITPIRSHHSGLVPVPGDGRYDWDAYLPISDRPNRINPSEGFIATANENLTSPSYQYINAIGYDWADPFRGHRVRELLGSGRRFTIEDMRAIQTDYLSIPARNLIPLLAPINIKETLANQGKKLLMDWDFILLPHSIAATIYFEWELQLEKEMILLSNPKRIYPIALSTKKLIDLYTLPDGRFGTEPLASRDDILIKSLTNAMTLLNTKLGTDMSKWQYGQPAYKHSLISHPLSSLLTDSLKNIYNIGPASRGGYGNTVGSTGDALNQASGASFRVIIDCSDWDLMLATNTPGQNGSPSHKHYRDLFPLWAADKYFPLFFSKEKILSVTEAKVVLVGE